MKMRQMKDERVIVQRKIKTSIRYPSSTAFAPVARLQRERSDLHVQDPVRNVPRGKDSGAQHSRSPMPERGREVAEGSARYFPIRPYIYARTEEGEYTNQYKHSTSPYDAELSSVSTKSKARNVGSAAISMSRSVREISASSTLVSRYVCAKSWELHMQAPNACQSYCKKRITAIHAHTSLCEGIAQDAHGPMSQQ